MAAFWTSWQMLWWCCSQFVSFMCLSLFESLTGFGIWRPVFITSCAPKWKLPVANPEILASSTTIEIHRVIACHSTSKTSFAEETMCKMANGPTVSCLQVKAFWLTKPWWPCCILDETGIWCIWDTYLTSARMWAIRASLCTLEPDLASHCTSSHTSHTVSFLGLWSTRWHMCSCGMWHDVTDCNSLASKHSW